MKTYKEIKTIIGKKIRKLEKAKCKEEDFIFNVLKLKYKYKDSYISRFYFYSNSLDYKDCSDYEFFYKKSLFYKGDIEIYLICFKYEDSFKICKSPILIGKHKDRNIEFFEDLNLLLKDCSFKEDCIFSLKSEIQYNSDFNYYKI